MASSANNGNGNGSDRPRRTGSSTGRSDSGRGPSDMRRPRSDSGRSHTDNPRAYSDRYQERSWFRSDAPRPRSESGRRPLSSDTPRYYKKNSRTALDRTGDKRKKRPRVFFHRALTRILLPKLLTKAHYLSPALAQQFIEAGRVRINARVVTSPYYEVNLRKERVTIDEAALEYPRRLYYMVYNKPRNVICNKGDARFDEIFDTESVWSFPFGRLEKSMSGLVVLSNDPRMIRTQHIGDLDLQKEYRVKLNRHLSNDEIDELSGGILVGDQYFVPLRMRIGRRNVDSMWLDLTVLDDAQHRIRQAFKVLGCEILKMSRIRISILNENMIPVGEWRELVSFEIPALGLNRFMRGELPPEPPPPPREKNPRDKFSKDRKFRRDDRRRDDRRGGRPGGRGAETPEDREERLRREALADAAGNK